MRHPEDSSKANGKKKQQSEQKENVRNQRNDRMLQTISEITQASSDSLTQEQLRNERNAHDVVIVDRKCI